MKYRQKYDVRTKEWGMDKSVGYGQTCEVWTKVQCMDESVGYGQRVGMNARRQNIGGVEKAGEWTKE